MNSLYFLIEVVFDLYIMVVLLRTWLQAVRADFYNPFSQFVVKATQPVVAPMRRVIPSIGSIDLATILLAYLLAVGKLTLINFLFAKNGFSFDVSILLRGALAILKQFGHLVFWILILRAILSWVSQGRSPMEYVFSQLTEPFLAPIRRALPDTGGLDLSLMVVILILQFAHWMMVDLVGEIWKIL